MRKETEQTVGGEGATTSLGADSTSREVAVTDQKLEEVIEQLRDVKRQATFMYALAVGKVVVEQLYGGSVDEWGKRRSEDTSFRRLANRLREEEELKLDAAALSRAVGVYELYHRVSQDVVTSQHLKANHYIAVLGLEVKTAEQLLRRADKQRWSVAQLRKEAAKKREKVSNGGRRPLLAFEKTLNRFGKVLEDADTSFGGLDQVESLDSKKADRFFNTLMDLSNQVERLKGAIRPRTTAFSAQPDHTEDA